MISNRNVSDQQSGLISAKIDEYFEHHSGANKLQKRPLADLINTAESAWPTVQRWLKDAKNPLEVLPANEPSRSQALEGTQVTTRSPMGAVIYETGGILVDNGWLRILGSGHPKLPRSLPEWNKSIGNSFEDSAPPFLLVGDDAIGGFYAIDGGGLGKPGNLFYFAPDSASWQDTGLSGYTGFLDLCCNADLEKYYSSLRWKGWAKEISSLKGDEGIFIYPPPFAKGPAIDKRHRKAVPMTELYGAYVVEFSKMASTGGTFQVKISE